AFRIPKERRTTLKEHFIHAFKPNKVIKFKALENINLEISQGEFLGIIGQNGSGKSTLLKLLAGIYQPNQGKISSKVRIAPFLELGIGFQQELSARENIYINGALLGLSKTQIDARLDQIVEFAEIAPFLNLKVKNFSSGMRSRLAFAIATQVDADLYLCDEILAVGDESFQKKCLKTFRNWHAEGKTIVFVSHNTDLVQEFCTRAVLIENGRLACEGEPITVINEYHARIAQKESQKHNFAGNSLQIKKVTSDQSKATREKISIQIHYHALETIQNPIFGIGIHYHDGTHITGPNTKTSNFPIDKIEGEGIIECELQNQNLLAGTYLISASCFNHDLTFAYDYHDKKYPLTITKNQENQYGVVDLSPEWNIVSNLRKK
ncbi:ATP-binding cassette domain-containing protein, partial [Candidatus Peregrinibacteria bacterium]|nr:ATP-binding cassette domain-containing protein [Candidatus Peregrinibacteria bacterium]